MMDLKPALALPKGFLLVGLEKSDESLTLTVVSTQRSPCCPLCGRASTRVHSSYTRHVSDLPCGGQPLRLLILVRKYVCQESTCPRKIFAERLTPFVDLFARVTKRRKNAVKGSDLAPTPPLTVRQTTFLFLRRGEELDADEHHHLDTLRHLHPDIDLAYDLAQQFAQMLRTRDL